MGHLRDNTKIELFLPQTKLNLMRFVNFTNTYFNEHCEWVEGVEVLFTRLNWLKVVSFFLVYLGILGHVFNNFPRSFDPH